MICRYLSLRIEDDLVRTLHKSTVDLVVRDAAHFLALRPRGLLLEIHHELAFAGQVDHCLRRVRFLSNYLLSFPVLLHVFLLFQLLLLQVLHENLILLG